MPQRQQGTGGRKGGGRRGNPQNLVPQFADLAHALRGIELPQDKQGLLDYVSENGDDDIIQLIEDLPEREYHTMADIMKGAGETPETRH
jgi:hypothetical protein